jgi:GntR family uxuAB operon transcriptional repressor
MSKRGSAEIAAEMRQAIAKGRFRRFERLPASRQLAASLGVARNTLRDALYQLEREGLLETRAGSGTYVRATATQDVPGPVKEATPLELIDARFALEPHICRLCILHGRREEIDTLDDLCAKMEGSVKDPIRFAEADTAFHRTLASTTRNSLLIWLISQINTVRSLDEWTRMRHLTLDENIIAQYNTQHREILNAIRSREPERAAAKMKEHLETARLSLTRAAET